MLPEQRPWIERRRRHSSGRPHIAGARCYGRATRSRVWWCTTCHAKKSRWRWGGGTIIEEYPDGHRALPDCLVLAWLQVGEPFHAVIAVDTPNDRVFVVTVYRPDPARWFDDWKRRRL